MSRTDRRRGNTGSYGLLSDRSDLYTTWCRSMVKGRKTPSFGNDVQMLEEGHGGFQKVMRALMEPWL